MLAGVTLNIVLNDNLVGKAEIATDSYNSEQAKEKLVLSLLSYKLALLSKEPDATLQKFLPEGATAILEGNKYIITMDGFTFEVDKNTLEILTQDGVSLGGTTGGSSTPEVKLEPGLYDANGVKLCSWEESGLDAECDDWGENNCNILENQYPTMTKIVLPDNVTTIVDAAFSGCSGLTSIDLSNVTTIGMCAFAGCSGLTSIDLSNVTTIGMMAFGGCSGLTSIDLSNVTTLENDAFMKCSSLTNIKVGENNIVYDSRNNCNAIIETSTNTLIVGCKNTVIPDNVTTIEYMAFGGCSSLTSIDLKNVTTIGYSAFSECSNLTSIDLGNVTTIRSQAFYGCSSLTSIDLSNITTIGVIAFSGCSNLTSVIYKGQTYTNKEALLAKLNEDGVSCDNTAFSDTGLS